MVMINIISSCGFTEHTHLSRTKRDVCGLPRNLIWNNGGHKFGGYLTMEPVSFPWGTIKGGHTHTASERGLPLMSLSLHYCSDGTAGGGADREMDTATEGAGGAFKRREEWD